jgi:hypothetical protein
MRSTAWSTANTSSQPSIAAVQRVVERAQVVVPHGCVLLGSRVTFRQAGESDTGETQVELTAPDVAEPTAGESPSSRHSARRCLGAVPATPHDF